MENNLFYLSDCEIKVVRAVVDYQTEEESIRECFNDVDSAEKFSKKVSGTVTALDTTDYEWMDGIVIDGPTTNPMIQALEIYHMGREAWEARRSAPSAEDRMAQMEADIAYLAMLTDTDMEV